MELNVALLTLIVGSLLALSYLLISSGSKKSTRSKQSIKASEVYTEAEVKKHNTASDCWIIVKNKVYDVTAYVEEHPGGYAILNNAGADSTKGFHGPQHSSRVFEMVDEFYIGELSK